MSRPRTPYGPNPPGRLAATMIKVLAAELSDPARLSRGKRYWAEHAVIDIVIGHGAVTAEVQGGRPTPYVVTLEAAAGAGVPTKRELWIRCTCPDDTETGAGACKHAVAVLFALSDEVAIEPTLLDRWRRTSRPSRADGDAAGGDASDPAPDRDAGPASTGGGRSDGATDDRSRPGARPLAEVIELRPQRDPSLDELSILLQAPGGSMPPELPEPTPLDHGPIRDRLLAEVLGDALERLVVRWE